MVKFMSQEFFQEVQRKLSEDSSWNEITKNINSSILLTVEDKNESYLITISNGNTSINKVEGNQQAEFSFKGSYDAWCKVGSGELDIQSAVLKGQLKFKGSITKVLFYKDRFMKIVDAMKKVEKEF